MAEISGERKELLKKYEWNEAFWSKKIEKLEEELRGSRAKSAELAHDKEELF